MKDHLVQTAKRQRLLGGRFCESPCGVVRAQQWSAPEDQLLNELGRFITRSFPLALALGRLRRRREAFLNPRFPKRRLARDGRGRLVAVEVEV